VAYNRRQQRRQGIRYGPPRERERYSDNGVLIGRFLGLGILLLTIGVLAAGALAFMGDLPGSTPAPTRTLPAVAASGLPSESAAFESSAPSQGPTTLPTTGTIPPTTVPSPAATIVPPLVQIGEGYVTFGTHSDNQLRITDPRSVFALDERIVWSAFLTELADSDQLRIQILKLDETAIGGETLISDEPVTPIVHGAQIFQRRFRAQATLDGPGLYVVRYLRNTDLLSEGFLEITE
jgi:hypothetical protein